MEKHTYDTKRVYYTTDTVNRDKNKLYCRPLINIE